MKFGFKKKDQVGQPEGIVTGAGKAHSKKPLIILAIVVLLFGAGFGLGYVVFDKGTGGISDSEIEARFTELVAAGKAQDTIAKLYENAQTENKGDGERVTPTSEDNKNFVKVNLQGQLDAIGDQKDPAFMDLINGATIAGQLGNTDLKDQYIQKAKAKAETADEATKKIAQQAITQAEATKPL